MCANQTSAQKKNMTNGGWREKQELKQNKWYKETAVCVCSGVFGGG